MDNVKCVGYGTEKEVAYRIYKELNPEKKKKSRLSCKVCDSKNTMYPKEIYKFHSSPALIVIGYLIAIPSIVAAIFFGSLSLFVFFSFLQAGLSMSVSLFSLWPLALAIISFMSGAVGYFLIMKRKVYICGSCHHIIDRAF